MNKLMIIGNLTRDPETRTFENSSVCSFTVAVNRRTRSDHPEADYFRVSAWGKLGECCAQYLQKGKKVCAIGPVRATAYTSRDGSQRAALEMTAESIEFLSPRSQGENQPAPQVDTASGMEMVETEDLPF